MWNANSAIYKFKYSCCWLEFTFCFIFTHCWHCRSPGSPVQETVFGFCIGVYHCVGIRGHCDTDPYKNLRALI